MHPIGPKALNAAFRKYEVQVRAYGISWWTQDSAVETILANNPKLVDQLAERALRGELVETKDIYRLDKTAGWHSIRRSVHARILEQLFGHSTPAADPTAVFLLGLPGSGKSSVLRQIAEGYLAKGGTEPPLTRDADEVRILLPEYSGGRGSQVVQREVVELTYQDATGSLPADSHLLIDVVGDPERLPEEVEYFSKQGRKIVVLCSQVPLEVAERRAKERALSNGRFVSIEYLRLCVGRPAEALRNARATSLVDHWALIDTTSTPPTVVEGDGSFGTPGQTAHHWR